MSGSFVRLAIGGLLAGCAHSAVTNVTIAPAPGVAAQQRAPGALPQPAASDSRRDGAVTICVIDPSSCDKQQCSAKASCGAKAACAGRP